MLTNTKLAGSIPQKIMWFAKKEESSTTQSAKPGQRIRILRMEVVFYSGGL
jgi:hypothetical protein